MLCEVCVWGGGGVRYCMKIIEYNNYDTRNNP